MYRSQSRWTADVIQHKIILDIKSKGFDVIEAPPEAIYDLIVDVGLVNGKREFKTIQVKKHLITTTRSKNKNGHCDRDHNGKERNSYDYYDYDISFLASVDKLGPYYIEKEEYKYKNSLELKSAIKIRVWPFINDKKTSWSKKEVFVEDQGLLRFLSERSI